MDFNLKNYNIRLVFYCIVLNIVGVFFVASASSFTARILTRQIAGSFASFGICIFLSLIDYRTIIKFSRAIYIFSIVILATVLVYGTAFGKNAVRWIEVPFVGQVQPAEFLKFAIIIFMADFLSKKDKYINNFSSIMQMIMYFSIPTLLVLVQPNLSSVIIISTIVLCMFLVSKIEGKIIAYSFIVVAVIIISFMLLVKSGLARKIPGIKSYQIERVETFLDPDANSEGNYQQENSVTAIGSGGLTGKGYNNQSTLSVKDAGWLSEQTNDFIFAVVGEEIGFRGSFFIILLFILLVVECFLIAFHQRDESAKYICVGVGSWIGFQAFINIGVAIRLVPNTGVPLPFFSQGLSSLLSIYLGIGVVLNISSNTRVYRTTGGY
ncbi:MAG: FtsW/RodA/SpoVE family cell cycle protein [Eubacteriales bacterium]|nr:FtsW/RodA/SpoVE family cell cycle protein [Eubacteriales bacterium]